MRTTLITLVLILLASGALAADTILQPKQGGTGLTSFSRSGTTTTFATTNGTLTPNHCVTIDANGNLSDTGAPCSSLPYTPLDAAKNLSDIASPSTARTNLSGAKSGVNSDITSITGLTTPLSTVQGGTGLTTFSRSGNTTNFATVSGPLSSGHCITIDANGNAVDSGAPCGGSLSYTPLNPANNLSDVANTTTSRTNLGAAKSGANSDITSFSNVNSLYMVNTTAPASLAGGSYLTSVNGVMTWVSPYYSASLFGGKYEGDATRPWITSPIGIGVDWANGFPQPMPNLRMQRVVNSTSNSAADNVLSILHQSNELYSGGIYPIGIITNCNATLGNGVCLTGTVLTARGTVLHKGTVSFTSGNPVLTYTGAQLTANQQVAFTTTGGTLPPPFVLNGLYYALPTGLTANTVQLSGGVQGGPPITPTASNTGTINYTVMPQGEMWTWNPVCDDRTGRRSTLSGAIACMETDLNAAGPDDQHIRIIQDNVGREKFGVNNGPSPDGMTSIWTGIDVRPVTALASSGPVEITHAFYPTSVGGMPGSFNRYDFFSDTGYFRFYGASPLNSAVTIADAAAADTALTFSNVFGPATSLSGIKPGDKICEQADCSSPVAIPAGTTATAFASPLNASNVLLGSTTVTLSAPLAAPLPTGTTLYIQSVATDGLFLSGPVSDAVTNLSSQYGQEEKLVNGLQVGTPTGGAKGVGTVNATGLYINGSPAAPAASYPSFSSMIDLPNIAGTSNATACIIGDSTATPFPAVGYAFDEYETIWGMLQQKLRHDLKGVNWTFANFAIPGANDANVAQSITTSGLTPPPWYTDTTKVWLTYPQAANCDILFYQFGTNAATSGLTVGNGLLYFMEQNMVAINGWTKVPKVIFVTNKTANPATDISNDDVNGSARQAQAAKTRTFAQSNGNSYTDIPNLRALGFGLIDLGRDFVIRHYGNDPASQSLVTEVSALTSSPQPMHASAVIGNTGLIAAGTGGTTAGTTQLGDYRMTFVIPAGGGTALYNYDGGHNFYVSAGEFVGNFLRFAVGGAGNIVPYYITSNLLTGSGSTAGTSVSTTLGQDVTINVLMVQDRVRVTINGTVALDTSVARYVSAQAGGTPINVGWLNEPVGSPKIRITEFEQGASDTSISFENIVQSFGDTSVSNGKCWITDANCYSGNSINHPTSLSLASDKRVIDNIAFNIPLPLGTAIVGGAGGGTGVNNGTKTATFPASGVTVMEDVTQTVTNKTISSLSNTINGTRLVGTTSNDGAPSGTIGEWLMSSCGSVAATATITIASPAVITAALLPGILNQGERKDNCPIVFTTTGALPTGLTAGTNYWVDPATVSGNSFSVATSPENALAGIDVATSGTQSGAHTSTVGVALTTITSAVVTELSLPGGNWDVWGEVMFNAGSGTIISQAVAAVGVGTNCTPTPAFPAAPNNGAYAKWVGSATSTGPYLPTGAEPVRIASTTTYCLLAQSGFGAPGMTASGALIARRRR